MRKKVTYDLQNIPKVNLLVLYTAFDKLFSFSNHIFTFLVTINCGDHNSLMKSDKGFSGSTVHATKTYYEFKTVSSLFE